MNRPRMIGFTVALGLAIIVTLIALAQHIVAYTDYALVSENTGSRQGYRQWFFGIQSQRTYEISSVEKFVRQKHPQPPKHRWTIYAETRHNIFGRIVSKKSSRTGAFDGLSVKLLDTLFTRLSDEDKLRFVELLSSPGTDSKTLMMGLVPRIPRIRPEPRWQRDYLPDPGPGLKPGAPRMAVKTPHAASS